MIARTTGVLAIVALAGCGNASDFTVQPYPSPSITRQPVGTNSTTDVAPSPLPTPTHRASRVRHPMPLILLRIRSCESGPNGYATHGHALDFDYYLTNPSSTASGAYQFLDGTWRSTTGLSGRAKNYPPAVQDAAALKLFAAEGTTPWLASKSCWGAA